jgi:hypothetical protein
MLLYAILITKCMLLHYFDSYPVRVVTSLRLGEIIRNRLATGRIAKWAFELLGARHNIRPTNGDLVLGLGGLRGGMNRNTTAACPGYPGTLEHVLQQLLHSQRGRGWYHVDLPQ